MAPYAWLGTVLVWLALVCLIYGAYKLLKWFFYRYWG